MGACLHPPSWLRIQKIIYPTKTSVQDSQTHSTVLDILHYQSLPSLPSNNSKPFPTDSLDEIKRSVRGFRYLVEQCSTSVTFRYRWYLDCMAVSLAHWSKAGYTTVSQREYMRILDRSRS